MYLVAVINGRKVFSDKTIVGIRNTLIRFADGSWCNTATSEMSTNGKGFIAFDALPDSVAVPAESTFTQKRFLGTELRLMGTSARVSIQPSDDPEIVIDAVGITEDDLDVQFIDGRVIVLQKSASLVGGQNVNLSAIVMTGDNNVLEVGGSTISISTTERESGNQLNIRVPKGTLLALSGITGRLEVGDVEGKVGLQAEGASRSHFGKIKSAKFHLSGASKVTANSVEESLVVEVSGASKVVVDAGNVETVDISAAGVSKVEFRGRAKSGSLKASGASKISVNHIDLIHSRVCSGVSKISVDNW